MKIGYLQFNPSFGKKEENLERTLHLVNEIETDLLVFPELFNTGYLFTSQEEVKELSEEIPQGPTFSRLLEVAHRKKMHIVAGILERAKDKFYNSGILLQPEGKFFLYRKAHLFFEEKLWFSPGDTPFQVQDIGQAKIGLLICFDWIFPEAMRVLALKGAQIICHMANLVLPYGQAAMITRAIENRVFVITANRIGTEKREGKEWKFTGNSQIVDPSGNILVKSKEDKEEIRIVEVDPSLASQKWITPQNELFRDRRIDLYQEILKKGNYSVDSSFENKIK